MGRGLTFGLFIQRSICLERIETLIVFWLAESAAPRWMSNGLDAVEDNGVTATHWKPLDTPDAPDPAVELARDLLARVEALEAAMETAHVDLDLLRRAISEGDPKAELLIRASDIQRRLTAARALLKGQNDE